MDCGTFGEKKLVQVLSQQSLCIHKILKYFIFFILTSS